MKFVLPLYIELWKIKKKKYYINLNNYRNWHYQVSNNIKKEFQNMVKQQIWLMEKDKLSKLKNKNDISIIYQVYYWDLKKRDKGNIYSIFQKFFLDSLVVNGLIDDDNDNIIWDEIFKKPIYDKGNWRIEIDILLNNK